MMDHDGKKGHVESSGYVGFTSESTFDYECK